MSASQPTAHSPRRSRQPGRRLGLSRRQGQPPGADVPRAARVRHRARTVRAADRERAGVARTQSPARTAAIASPRPPGGRLAHRARALHAARPRRPRPKQMKPTIERILSVESRVMKKDPEVADMEPTSTCDSSAGRGPRRTSPGSSRPRGPCLAPAAAGQEQHAARAGGAEAAARPRLRHRRGELRQPPRPRHHDRADPRADARLCCSPCRARSITRGSMPSVGYLRVHALKATDLEHLAWARLALDVHDSDTATRERVPRTRREDSSPRASDPNDLGRTGWRSPALAVAESNAVPAAVRRDAGASGERRPPACGDPPPASSARSRRSSAG